MKNVYLTIITIFSLMALLTLQLLWSVNTYLLIKEDIYKEINEVLDRSFKQETMKRLKSTPKGTRIETKEAINNIPEITYLEEGLHNLGYPISIDCIDSIANSILVNDYHINSEFVINILSLKTERIIISSKDYNTSLEKDTINSKIIPIRTDLSKGIQLVIYNPYKVIFNRMIILLLLSFIMVLFALFGLLYQIKLIIEEKKMNQLRENFSLAMVHNIRMPLSSILFSIKSIRLVDNNNDILKDYYQIIEKNVYDLIGFTDSHLTFFKLDNKRLNIIKHTVSLSSMINDLQKKYASINDKIIHYSIELEIDSIYVDEYLMKEVLINLIDNSIKYSKKSEVEITIRSLCDKKNNIIKIRDNGIGISSKDQKIIFKKYEKASALKRTLKQKGIPGYGLGLYYVNKIIQAHEGQIFVESVVGEYTEFTILIPKI